MFMNCVAKTKRCKNNYKKFTKVYYGLAWKIPVSKEDEFKFQHISNMIQENTILISKTDHAITLGHFNGCLVNGNRILTEITFHSSGIWNVTISGKKVFLDDLKISDTFELSKESIKCIIDLAKNFIICSGVDESEINNIIDLPENALRENRADTSHDSIFKYRSKNCKGVVPFQSKLNVCAVCRKFKNKNNDNDFQNDNKTLQKPCDDLPVNNNNLLQLKQFLGGFPEKAQSFLLSQTQFVNLNPHARRWDKDIIRMCLSIYCRSPRAYEDLAKSGFMVLPSKCLLQTYKNRVQHEPGIQKDILHWMKNEALAQNIGLGGYEGGIMLDEMSIQEDLELRKKGNSFEIIGFNEGLDETNYMKTLCSGKESLQLASHVLQLLFLGHTGFRFPFAHYPTTQVTPSEMLLIFWQSVKMLGLFGFTVTYVSLDGAQYNRDFMKILIDGKTSETMFSMSIKNIYDSSKPNIHVIMDYSHVMKKIRNNISKSGLLNTHKKVLKFESNHIFWEHWYKAYQWDIAVNPFKIYQQLTMEHFFLTSQSKMRNKLAEDVLNENMLHLMQCYQISLKEKGDELNSSIEFLKKTSVLAKNFRDQRPICQYSDKRLDENREVLNWFRAWEASIKQSTEIKDKEKCLLSFQTREDLTSLLVGFDEMCKDRFQRISSSIIPNRINSDVLENIFSQQRGLHNGANTNPTYLTYSRTMNTIILGEGSISRKSNTGGLSNCTTTNIYTTGTSKETCSEPCKKIRKQ